jgi:hypothetical protein
MSTAWTSTGSIVTTTRVSPVRSCAGLAGAHMAVRAGEIVG